MEKNLSKKWQSHFFDTRKPAEMRARLPLGQPFLQNAHACRRNLSAPFDNPAVSGYNKANPKIRSDFYVLFYLGGRRGLLGHRP